MLNWIVWNRTVYLYKIDLALNNIQRLICHKTQPTNNCICVLVLIVAIPTSWTKNSNIKNNKQRKEGRKKWQNTNLRTAKRKKVKSGTFLALYVILCLMWLSQELSKNPTQLPKMLGHLWSSSSLLNIQFLIGHRLHWPYAAFWLHKALLGSES